MSEVIQGNDFEAQFGHDAAQNVNLTKYDALNRALDIESFHTFVDYLLKRGPGGDHNGEVWSIRQKHWRNASKLAKPQLFRLVLKTSKLGSISNFYRRVFH